MNYITKVQYKNATIEFYFMFSNNDGFLEYLSKKKRLKEELKALSFAIALNKNTVRIIMPFGTKEKEFQERMNNVFQREYNAFSFSYTKSPDYYADAYSMLWNGLFNGKK